MVARTRTRVLGLIVGVVVLGAAAVLYVIAGSRPFAADRAPGPVETAIARRLVRLSIPPSERQAANPFAGDRSAWRSAADLAHHNDGAGAAAATVVMDGTAFQPAEVNVRAGELIEWVNKDPFPHNVSADAAGLHSGDVEPDRTWRFRAVTRGTFQYVCSLHPGMSGVLHVH